MAASTKATAAAAGQSSRSIEAVTTEGASAERIDKLAAMIGEVADRVLKDVSDRMPGLEAWAISTLDTIFAPRLVLRSVCKISDTTYLIPDVLRNIAAAAARYVAAWPVSGTPCVRACGRRFRSLRARWLSSPHPVTPQRFAFRQTLKKAREKKVVVELRPFKNIEIE